MLAVTASSVTAFDAAFTVSPPLPVSPPIVAETARNDKIMNMDRRCDDTMKPPTRALSCCAPCFAHALLSAHAAPTAEPPRLTRGVTTSIDVHAPQWVFPHLRGGTLSACLSPMRQLGTISMPAPWSRA